MAAAAAAAWDKNWSKEGLWEECGEGALGCWGADFQLSPVLSGSEPGAVGGGKEGSPALSPPAPEE